MFGGEPEGRRAVDPIESARLWDLPFGRLLLRSSKANVNRLRLPLRNRPAFLGRRSPAGTVRISSSNPKKGEAMSSQWVDFRELRAKLRFSEVLKHYHVELKVKGDQAMGFCPLPGHPPHEGKRRPPSFSVNLDRGIFQCFSGGCARTGGILGFPSFFGWRGPPPKARLRKGTLPIDTSVLGTAHHPPPAN